MCLIDALSEHLCTCPCEPPQVPVKGGLKAALPNLDFVPDPRGDFVGVRPGSRLWPSFERGQVLIRSLMERADDDIRFGQQGLTINVLKNGHTSPRDPRDHYTFWFLHGRCRKSGRCTGHAYTIPLGTIRDGAGQRYPVEYHNSDAE
jgi:hypothetical protein